MYFKKLEENKTRKARQSTFWKIVLNMFCFSRTHAFDKTQHFQAEVGIHISYSFWYFNKRNEVNTLPQVWEA